jgi:hypothetical protein
MSEKSHVGMGFLICPVTGNKHSESVLLDKKMEDKLDKENFLGYAYCPEVAEKIAEGYVCLIEIKNENSDNEKRVSMKDADRTGVYCFIKKELAKDMFGIEGEVEEIQFVSPEVTEFLANLKTKTEEENGESSEKSEV